MSDDFLSKSVMELYAHAARNGEQVCVPDGYDMEFLATYIPQSVLQIAMGCGVPVGLGTVRLGETILDVGSGGGIDCFEASRLTGKDGLVIGVDMTDEMLEIARNSAATVATNLGYPQSNVEFRKGRAEKLPVDDQTIDLIISNCVINLAQDKQRVFQEMYRALKIGGRFTISDVVADTSVPNYLLNDQERWGACLSGAMYTRDYLRTIRGTGFVGVHQIGVAPWGMIDGVHFSALTVTGYKVAVPPSKPSNEEQFSGYAVLKGPFKWVIDEYDQTFVRGLWRSIDQKTLDLLHLDPFRPWFLFSKDVVSGKMLNDDDPELLRIIPEDKPCVWQGHFATMTSLFERAEDDDHHQFESGVPIEICSKTNAVLATPQYASFFHILNRSQQSVSGEAVSCSPNGECC
ncbi:MAG: hypothetical protein CMH81_03290 [Nitrospiraceae bacterium]|nr:hypothetical protein [Nitrospiraceae bacterium]|tara:strand:- start:3160 stop:4371 length:1212 start_codon:yes stop_codon:yes gene_type:complete